jgi:F1F0 ATPase subunit 2
MNEFVILPLAGAGGVLLGMIFFGGLWWTVQKGLSSERAALWFLGSLILRTSVVLVGFCLISQGDWRYLLACLVGFLAARIGVTLFLRKKGGNPCA